MVKKVVLGCALILSILFVGKTDACAKEQGIYLQSKVPPSDVSNYVLKNWQLSLDAQTLISGEDSNQFYLGRGFSIETDGQVESYFFPLAKKNSEVSYLLEVSSIDNNEYSLNVSPYWVDKLNSLSEITNLENPATLIEKNGRLFSEQNNNADLLMERFTPESESTPFETPDVDTDSEDITVINISEQIENYKTTPQRKSRVYEQATYNLDIVNNFEIWENQYELPWCGAYALGGIINYKQGDEVTSAEKILKWIYPKKNMDELKKSDVGLLDLVKYSDSWGYKPKFANRALTFEEVKKNVSNDDPTLALLRGLSVGTSVHSIDILGWLQPPKSSGQPNMMYIWNPWYQVTSPMIYNDSHTMILSANKYVWEGSLYNFK